MCSSEYSLAGINIQQATAVNKNYQVKVRKSQEPVTTIKRRTEKKLEQRQKKKKKKEQKTLNKQ